MKELRNFPAKYSGLEDMEKVTSVGGKPRELGMYMGMKERMGRGTK